VRKIKRGGKSGISGGRRGDLRNKGEKLERKLLKDKEQKKRKGGRRDSTTGGLKEKIIQGVDPSFAP